MRKAVYRDENNIAVFLHASDSHVQLQRAKLILKSGNIELLFEMEQDYDIPFDERIEKLHQIRRNMEEEYNFKSVVMYGWLV